MKSASEYKCVIIDDDDNSTELLKEYLQSVPKLSLLESFSDPTAAVRAIKNNERVTFLFLDINMEISGLNIARILRDDVRFIVFVTGHPEHALNAFSVKADRYLVKPVSFQKFVKTVNQLECEMTRTNC
ncbi:response regulator [Pedobacter sp. MC2016-05]|uniref:LytR/AlgR family response regulator transcription factor n=1 Tax=Pedobacter sp. MC2016-05 TaxID=2994474 RepID=UPI0022483F32|nr:response regulator [Pedobacter sp. MC2016-05]MCX2477219.1 response regulator [Pedobacter sp. MC2016-05]